MQDVATLEAVRLPDRDTRWMDDANCRNHPEVNFFPAAPNNHSGPAWERYKQEVEEAKMVCEFCPVKADCLKDATERNEHWGVWGGQDLYVSWRKLRNRKEIAS